MYGFQMKNYRIKEQINMKKNGLNRDSNQRPYGPEPY